MTTCQHTLISHTDVRYEMPMLIPESRSLFVYPVLVPFEPTPRVIMSWWAWTYENGRDGFPLFAARSVRPLVLLTQQCSARRRDNLLLWYVFCCGVFYFRCQCWKQKSLHLIFHIDIFSNGLDGFGLDWIPSNLNWKHSLVGPIDLFLFHQDWGTCGLLATGTEKDKEICSDIVPREMEKG